MVIMTIYWQQQKMAYFDFVFSLSSSRRGIHPALACVAFSCLASLKLLDAVRRRGEIFRHGPAQFLDRLPHFLSHLIMNFIGRFFPLNAFPADLGFRLGHPEPICGEFLGAHVIEDLLALFQPFTLMDAALIQPIVKAPIAVVLEDGIIPWLDHPCAHGGVGQVGVVESNIPPDRQPALILQQFILIGKFLPAGLNGKVSLAEGDDLLAGVGILDGQIAGIAGHQNRFDGSFGLAADLDHFGDVTEMVLHGLAAIFTGDPGPCDHVLKIAIIRIAEDLGKFPAGPEFVARVGIDVFDRLKGRGVVGGSGFGAFGHRSFLYSSWLPERVPYRPDAVYRKYILYSDYIIQLTNL